MSSSYYKDFSNRSRYFIRILFFGLLPSLSAFTAKAAQYVNDYDAAGLIAACGFSPLVPAGHPFVENGASPNWRWEAGRNPMYGREFDARQALAYSGQAQGSGFAHATCEALLLDALLTESGISDNSLVAQRCSSYRTTFHSKRRNLETATASMRSSRFNTVPEFCVNPNDQNRAHFACAFAKHEADFRDPSAQLDAMNIIESICTSVGEAPVQSQSPQVARNTAGFDPHQNYQQCNGQNTVIIQQAQRRPLEVWGDIFANLGAIWALDRANNRQNQNANDAIHANAKLGLGSIVTSGANGQMGFMSGVSGSMSGFYGAGGCGGYGTGGIGFGAGIGIGGGLGVGHGAYSPCAYGMYGGMGAGYGAYPGYGMGGYGYPGYGYGTGGYPGYGYGMYGSPYGGSYGYPSFGGAGGAGGIGGYGMNGMNPWGGSMMGGSPYFGGYGGAGAYAQAMLQDMRRMQHHANELSQAERQIQSLDRDMQRLNERRANVNQNYYSTYSQFSRLSSGYGGMGGMGGYPGYGMGAYPGYGAGYGMGGYPGYGYGMGGYPGYGMGGYGGQYCILVCNNMMNAGMSTGNYTTNNNGLNYGSTNPYLNPTNPTPPANPNQFLK